jgi:hypothetical protein
MRNALAEAGAFFMNYIQGESRSDGTIFSSSLYRYEQPLSTVGFDASVNDLRA